MARKFLIGLSLFVFILCATLLALSPAEASDFQLVELKDVTIGYKSFFPGSYQPQLAQSGIPNRTLGKELNLNLGIDLLRYAYFNSRVHGTTDEIIENGKSTGKGQFREVGWNFQLGIRPHALFSIEYEHHSQHMLDWQSPTRFPVEDSIGIKVFIYKSKEPSETIF